ncbi:MAG: hypothetical protein PHU85_01315 [Phycisphaerae bacterium]|nr:hypothetical protein [Phycisphaerae bacterium]
MLTALLRANMIDFGRRLVFSLLLLAISGVVLLNSPPPGARVEGVSPRNGFLRSVQKFLSLGYILPAEPADQIKALMLRGGATAIAVVAMIAGGLSIRSVRRPRPQRASRTSVNADEREALLDADIAAEPRRFAAGRLGLPGWSLVLLLAWLAWAVAATRWSHAPRESLAYAESFAFVLALGLVVACTLDRWLVQRAAMFYLALAAVVAALAIAFSRIDRTGRGPMAFVGDARQLAGLMLPALVLAVVKIAGRVAELFYPDDDAPRSGRVALLRWALYATPAALAGWLVWRGGSAVVQGAAFAGVVGLGVAAALLTRGRWRAAWIAGCVATVALRTLLLSATTVAPMRPTPANLQAFVNQSAPLIDAGPWSIGSRLVRERPLTGHGGWSSRLLADQLAARKSLADPRWANRPVGSLPGFWLEQLADLGVVGVSLLSAALLLIVVSAGRAIRTCPWRRHRYLTAALAGGLAAMAVHELFASSLAGHAFAAVFALWAGLTVAASRWANRSRPRADQPDFVVGFYAGGITFLAGAAVVLSAIGYIVIQDWQSARGYATAMRTDLPAARALQDKIERDESDPLASRRPAMRRVRDQRIGQREDRLAAALLRLDRVTRWAIDSSPRVGALVDEARVSLAHARWRVTDQATAGLSEPVPLVVTASWADTALVARELLARYGRIHPEGPGDLPELRAEALLVACRARYLSYSADSSASPERRHANAIVTREMRRAATRARVELDAHLVADPHDLSAALLRESLGDRAAAAERLDMPGGVVDWLSAQCGLTVPPAGRLRLMRDALRDFGAVAAEPGNASLVVGPPDWLGLAAAYYTAIARVDRDLPAAREEWDAMLAAADRAECERGGGIDWAASGDPDVRNAPQTFRLAAEMAIVRNFAARQANVPAIAGVTRNYLQDAEAFLARADRLYARDPQRFATQRVIVALQRVQLAWGRGDKPAMRGQAESAQRSLTAIPPGHRAEATEAVAAVSAFVLAATGDAADAGRWFAATRYAAMGSLSEFRAEISVGWRGWLAPAPTRPAPTTRPASSTQPDRLPPPPIRGFPIPLPGID